MLVFVCVKIQKLTENPEKSFEKYLLHSKESLFYRIAREGFDNDKSFLKFSACEFIILCYQRAIVNRKNKMSQVLDINPSKITAEYMQKYIHLNIDKYQDWQCLGECRLRFL